MSSRNIIPDKIHPKIWKNGMGDIDDIILYALSSHSPIPRAEFITDDESRRMNKNTFHIHAKELRKKGFIDSYREGKNSFYKILPSGENEISRRLIKYDLDFDTLVEIEKKKNQNLVNKFSRFFRDNEIEDIEVQLEYLKLASVITHDKLSEVYSEEEFNKLLLYLTLNHAKFFREYSIQKEDFIKKYNQKTDGELSESYISTFIELIVDRKKYGVGFHKLRDEKNDIDLYFAENSEFGEIFKIIVDNKLKDLVLLDSLGIVDLNYSELQNTYNEIIECLIEDFKLFPPSLEDSLYQLIDNYRDSIKQQIIKRVPDDLVKYTTFSLLPERNIKQESIRLNEKRKIETLSEIRFLIEIDKIHVAKSKLKNLLNNEFDDDLLFNLTDLAVYLVKDKKYDMTDMIFESAPDLNDGFGHKSNSLFENFYHSEVHEELIKNNYNEVLRLVENFEIYYGEYEGLGIGILESKISALIGLGRFNEALEILDDLYKNSDNYQVFIDEEYFPYDYEMVEVEEGIEREYLDKEGQEKSFLYEVGILKSQIFTKMGNFYESLEVLDNIFELGIQTPKLFSLKAMNEIDLEIYKTALNTIDDGLKIAPNHPKLNQIKANALFKLHRYDDALVTIDSVINLDPYFDEHDSAKNLVLKAWIFFYKNNLNKALQLVNEIYQKFPNLSDLYEIGSLIYELKGKYKESLDVIGSVEDEGEVMILYNKALLLKNIKKNKEALETINLSIKENPNNYLNYDMKAMILAEMEKYEEALDQIEISINLQQEIDKDAIFNKEQILQKQAFFSANHGDKEKAIKVIQEAIKLNPDYASKSYEIYGEILMAFSNFEQAIQQFEISKTLPSTPIETYIKLGKCYLEKGQDDEALNNLQKGKHEAEHRIKKRIITEEGKRIEVDDPQTELIEEAEGYIDEIKSGVFYAFILELVLNNGKKIYYTDYTPNLYAAWNKLRESPPLKDTKYLELKYFDTFLTRTEAKRRSIEIKDFSDQKIKELIQSIYIK